MSRQHVVSRTEHVLVYMWNLTVERVVSKLNDLATRLCYHKAVIELYNLFALFFQRHYCNGVTTVIDMTHASGSFLRPRARYKWCMTWHVITWRYSRPKVNGRAMPVAEWSSVASRISDMFDMTVCVHYVKVLRQYATSEEKLLETGLSHNVNSQNWLRHAQAVIITWQVKIAFILSSAYQLIKWERYMQALNLKRIGWVPIYRSVKLTFDVDCWIFTYRTQFKLFTQPHNAVRMLSSIRRAFVLT